MKQRYSQPMFTYTYYTLDAEIQRSYECMCAGIAQIDSNEQRNRFRLIRQRLIFHPSTERVLQLVVVSLETTVRTLVVGKHNMHVRRSRYPTWQICAPCFKHSYSCRRNFLQIRHPRYLWPAHPQSPA